MIEVKIYPTFIEKKNVENKNGTMIFTEKSMDD
jgi:hypothetical protein